MFTSYPTYSRYRTLHLTNPMQRGEDVYALQTALTALGVNPGTSDGILGPQTAAAIKAAQQKLGITIDGLAGGETQESLARKLSVNIAQSNGVPVVLVRGQMAHESSFRLGNYSVLYPDGGYDTGVVQRNTDFTPPAEGFDAPKSLNAICEHTKTYFDKFAGISNTIRRWGLAAGAWNAPAFACYIAKEEGATNVKTSETAKPSDAQRATLEAYITDVTVYL